MRKFVFVLSVALATLVPSLFSLAMPGSVAAARAPITFARLRLGDGCLVGLAPPSTTLHLVWRSAEGDLKAKSDIDVPDWGRFEFCSDAVLAVGDVLRARDGDILRKFVMPLVTVHVDRVGDVFHGIAPAGTRVRIGYIYNGCCADYEQQATATTDDAGHWTFAPGYDIAGFYARVTWKSKHGDTVVDHGVAPRATVFLGRSTVAGDADRGTDVKLVLRDGDTGSRKATANAIADDNNRFQSVFLDDAGHEVTVAPGDRVVSSLASDLHFRVGDIQAVANTANDTVSGSCERGSSGLVEVIRTGKTVGYAFMHPDADGDFVLDFGLRETLGYNPANIKSGDRIVVYCTLDTSDTVAKSFRVE